MPTFIGLVFAAVVGAFLAVSFRPGIPEILIVAVLVVAVLAFVQRRKIRRKVEAT